MNFTRLIYHLAFARRHRQIQQYATRTAAMQEEQRQWLLGRAQRTAFGRAHGLRPDMNAAQYAQAVPLATYDEQKPDIERMLAGEADVLWPGRCTHFAKSSGTTSDKSKFLPITDDALRRNHYRGGTDAVVIYLALNPASRMFSGKGLVLGGSFDPSWTRRNTRVGDLSATLIDRMPALGEWIRVPSKQVALMSEWEAKLEAIVAGSVGEDVTNISGVPSWMMGVLQSVLRTSGRHDLTEVWPNLEVFFHGGIAFTPYRAQYEELIPSAKMHYLETYNASEGFFGIQSDWDDHALQLIVDAGVYYEFIPMSEFDNPSRRAIPLTEIEVGRNYAMVITTAGLYRYIIGDTVRFTQRDPYKFYITGRTQAFINAFGEELMVSNADEALAMTCQATGARISDYTAAPVFAQAGRKGRHTWVIEFTRRPDDVGHFADLLDQNLQRVNSDYEAKRYKGIFLDRLTLEVAPTGTFEQWLRQKKGKLGGQIKIPRLSGSSTYVDELRAIIAQQS